jgi:hypothetical protein
MAESQVEPSPGKLALVASPSADTTTVDIATADGDILLVLGETRLRVSSVILSSASPVFKTMFRPNFKEGQGDRSAQDPKEVAMVDDDLAAMTTLCRLLHHQRSLPEDLHDQGSLEPHARELLKLAVLADKYDCTGSIQMAVGYLFFDLAASSKPGEMPMAALLYLTAASFVMEDRRHFALFTRRLMMDHTSDYILVAHHPAVAILPGLFLRKSANCAIRIRRIGANMRPSAPRTAAQGCMAVLPRRADKHGHVKMPRIRQLCRDWHRLQYLCQARGKDTQLSFQRPNFLARRRSLSQIYLEGDLWFQQWPLLFSRMELCTRW